MPNRASNRVICSIYAAAAIGIAGCSSNENHQQIEQKAPAPTIVTTPLCDLGIDSTSFPADSGTHVLSGDLPALKPMAGIAVARVRCEGDSAGRPLQVEPISAERAALWVQLVSDLARVREIVVLGTLSMDPRGVVQNEILDAARAQECNYCLIFQMVDPIPSAASIRAVLWDTESKNALIAFQAAIQLPQAIVEKCSEDEEVKLLREADASYQVEAELRGLVRDALWDMAARTASDQGPTSRPNPWKTDQPILPRDNYRNRHYFFRGGE